MINCKSIRVRWIRKNIVIIIMVKFFSLRFKFIIYIRVICSFFIIVIVITYWESDWVEELYISCNIDCCFIVLLFGKTIFCTCINWVLRYDKFCLEYAVSSSIVVILLFNVNNCFISRSNWVFCLGAALVSSEALFVNNCRDVSCVRGLVIFFFFMVMVASLSYSLLFLIISICLLEVLDEACWENVEAVCWRYLLFWRPVKITLKFSLYFLQSVLISFTSFSRRTNLSLESLVRLKVLSTYSDLVGLCLCLHSHQTIL